MSESRDEAQFRQHLAEMRRAAGGIGRDFAAEFSDLDRKIERLGHATAKEAKYLALDIQDDFANLGKAMDEEVRRIPQHLANAGIAIGSGAARAGAATRDAFVEAGHRAKVGTKNALASAAGVKRTPMREWSAPTTGDEPPRSE
jgi:NADP-dependent 3-hydroxy acid dehydrogenase YdfG